MASSRPPSAASGTCPICTRLTVAEYRPFCSRRCADIDLSRWLRGIYTIPDDPASDAADEADRSEQGGGEPGSHEDR
jgi:endogenous inhibitor of DNA gyrase (YacG/DUF329 family)